MTISLTVVLAIIVIHYIADFIFQDEKWALGKSNNWEDLLKHTLTYSYIWLICGVFFNFNSTNSLLTGDINLFKETLSNIILFTLITFICHTITDYFTSRWVSKKFKAGHLGSPIPNFGAFSSIGLDQLSHYIQLILTYYFLTK